MPAEVVGRRKHMNSPKLIIHTVELVTGNKVTITVIKPKKKEAK